MQNDFSMYFSATAANSRKGLVRDVNEDALLSLPQDGFFAVADGMGGASAGETASSIVMQNLKNMNNSCKFSPGERKYTVQQELHKSNFQITMFADQHHYSAMGTTVTAIIFNPWDASLADICCIGDSRCYCCRGKELFLLTKDQILSNRKTEKHILTNSLGCRSSVYAVWEKISVCGKDRFLLCSDGLSSVVNDQEIQSVLADAPCAEESLAALEQAILQKGAPDNYSMICIDMKEELPSPVEIEDSEKMESDYLYSIAERRKDYGKQ